MTIYRILLDLLIDLLYCTICQIVRNVLHQIEERGAPLIGRRTRTHKEK